MVQSGLRAAVCMVMILGACVTALGCGTSEPSAPSTQTTTAQSATTEPAPPSTEAGVTPSSSEPINLGMALEFTDHAASAMVALEKGWFAEEGLDIAAYESYVTGVDLAAALARGDIQVAYMCLVPAISVRANGGVPIKVVAGTHLYGYGLVANPAKVATPADLAKPDVKIACTQPGASADILLQRICTDGGLPTADIMGKVQRMNPPSQVLALQAGAVDACLVPEHWATLAESLGFTMLLTAQDMWDQLQGSVLVVKEDLIRDRPDVVEKLVEVTQRADEWMNANPDEAAAIIASRLTATGQSVFPEKAAEAAAKLDITPELIKRSMARLTYATSVDPAQVQATIDYMDQLGYLKQKITADTLLDLTFLSH